MTYNPKFIEVTERDREILSRIYYDVATVTDSQYINALLARVVAAETLDDIVHRIAGPKFDNRLDELNQDEWWYSSSKNYMKIADMNPAHAKNTVKWLHENAVSHYVRLCPRPYTREHSPSTLQVHHAVFSSKQYRAILERSWE